MVVLVLIMYNIMPAAAIPGESSFVAGERMCELVKVVLELNFCQYPSI